MIVPNNIVFEGKRRYYIEDLTERDYFLENTTPYKLEYKDYCLSETSWGGNVEKFSYSFARLISTCKYL